MTLRKDLTVYMPSTLMKAVVTSRRLHCRDGTKPGPIAKPRGNDVAHLEKLLQTLNDPVTLRGQEGKKSPKPKPLGLSVSSHRVGYLSVPHALNYNVLAQTGSTVSLVNGIGCGDTLKHQPALHQFLRKRRIPWHD